LGAYPASIGHGNMHNRIGVRPSQNELEHVVWLHAPMSGMGLGCHTRAQAPWAPTIYWARA